jgi:hypothetical protein
MSAEPGKYKTTTEKSSYNTYIHRLSFNHRNHPAITLNLLGSKAYVVNTPALVNAVQRNHKLISMDPFLTQASSSLAGMHGDDLLRVTETRKGGGGANQKVIQAIHNVLLAPATMNAMVERMVVNLQSRIDELADSADAVTELTSWCRSAISTASTDAVYGDQNPYRDPKLEQAFW